MKKLNWFWKLVFWLGIFLLLFLILNIFVFVDTRNQIFGLSDIEKLDIEEMENRIILVLWAGVMENNQIGTYYQDRLDTAIILHEMYGNKILVSADNSKIEYDEVRSARDYLIEKWIGSENIFLDFAGFDTYDSLYRAKEIFGVENIIIVSQEFHLWRAIWIANNINVSAIWVYDDSTILRKRDINYYKFRESVANIKAGLDLMIKNNPTYTWESIDIEGESNAFWYD